MKRILALLALLCFIPLSYGQEPALDKETQALCNKVMLNIFADIMSVKDKYQVLSGFDQSALTKNKNGVFRINYENPNFKNLRGDGYYQLDLTIVNIEENPLLPSDNEAIGLSFPLLNVKFSGFQTKSVRAKRFDVNPVLEKQGGLLYDYQQRFMPLQLTLKPKKDTYQVGERISFVVTLTNQSQQNYKVKVLGEDSLFFTIDDRVWGTQPDQAKSMDVQKDELLYPASSISRAFKGESFKMPEDVEIRGVYNLVYKGVYPTASIKIKIVKQQ